VCGEERGEGINILWRPAFSLYTLKIKKMINKIKEIALKIWNILNDKDTNMDGNVDIHDAMLRAERKAKNGK